MLAINNLNCSPLCCPCYGFIQEDPLASQGCRYPPQDFVTVTNVADSPCLHSQPGGEVKRGMVVEDWRGGGGV